MAPASTLEHAAFSFVVLGGLFRAACSAFPVACLLTSGGSEPQLLKSPKRVLLLRSSALGIKRWRANYLSFEPLGFGQQSKENAQR
jgi:hypothetical protein